MKNSAFTNGKDVYYSGANEYLISLVPSGPNKVLDLGCGAGLLGKKLLEFNKAAEVVGVEIFESAAKEAMKYYKTVHIGDIEEMDLDYKDHFNIVICGDILEHLREPSNIIKNIYIMMKKGGSLICSVPNVRYWRVWKKLVFDGMWEYESEGILDQTHMRFFTTNTFKKLLTDSSFFVEYQGMRIAVGPKQRAFNRITFGIFKEFLGIQMLFSARKV